MRYTSLLQLVTVFLLALPGCAPKLSPVITVLEPVERELSGAEAQSHKIILPADKYFRIEVEQIGIDAIVELRGPDAKTITAVNTPTGRVGSESLLLQTTNAGNYQLLVRSNEYAKKEGRYRLTIEELSNETRSDKHRLKAEQAMTEAARLNFDIAGSTGAEAIEKLRADAVGQYKIARSIWKRLDNTAQKGWSLYFMAAQCLKLFEWQQAAEFAHESAALFRQTGDKLIMASVLEMQAESLIETQKKEDFKHALKLLEESLAVQKAEGNLYGQAVAVNTLGMAFYRQRELAKASERFVTASAMFNELGELQLAIWALNNVGAAQQASGEYSASLATYKRALKLSTAGEYRLERAFLLSNIAIVYGFQRNLQEALLNYREAAALFDNLGDRLNKAAAMTGIAMTYSQLGNWQAALGFFKQALELQAHLENDALVETYLHMGKALRNLLQPLAALKVHQKALDIATSPMYKARAHVELGRDYAAQGDYANAMSHYDLALQSAERDEATLTRALALQERGQLQIEQNVDVRAGLTDLRQALQHYRRLHSLAGEAQSLQSMARAEHKLGHVMKATGYAEKALDITEALRIRVGSPKLRLSFTGLQSPSYELHIALLMELASAPIEKSKHTPNYAALALEVSERARARSLVELLTEARTDDKQGISPELLQARSDKRQELANLAYQLESLLEENSDLTVKTQRNLQTTQADLDIIEARIYKQNRQYAKLLQPQILTATDIQDLLAPNHSEDKSTALVEYSLGEEQSFLWYVTEKSIESRKLPGRKKIEKAARAAYEKLRTLDLDGESRTAQQRASATLANMILGPIAHRLQGQRIVIVPDGALQYIPFGALPIPGKDGSPVPLLTRHEVIVLPSIATLATLRKTQQERQPAKKSIAIFADPVFNTQDPRLTGSPKIASRLASRSAEERGRHLLRLPASGREADAIASLAGPETVLKATGFDASLAKVRNSPLEDYRYLHFATHGLIDTQYPELSSLALSAFDQDGTPQPSLLRLHDIYSLNINADLVVLSACEAALGKDIRGEGLIGLTRGFMYAGTSRVVASLWRASDEVTASLMQEFYRQMLKKGLKPANALRKAQLAIAKRRKWRDPYYWAGFILQGDWR